MRLLHCLLFSRVDVIEGDALDAKAVGAAIRGHDCVISVVAGATVLHQMSKTIAEAVFPSLRVLNACGCRAMAL